MKKTSLAGQLALGAFGILLGVFLLLLNSEVLIKAIFILFGALILLSGVPQLILAFGSMKSNKKEALFDLITALINIAVGILLIFFRNTIAMIIIGIYLIIVPLVRVFTSKNKKAQFKKELFRLLLGLLMVVIGPFGVVDMVFDVIGWALVVVFAVYVIVAIVRNQNKKG